MTKIVATALMVGVAAALLFTPGGQGFFASLVAGVGTTFGVGTTMAAFIAGAGVGAVMGIVGEIAKPSGYDMGAQSGAKIPVTNTVASRQIIYGTARVAGSEAAIDEDDPDPSNDTPNQDLIFARVVADHPIEGFGQFYLGDEQINFTPDGFHEDSTVHGENLRIRKKTGDQTTADFVLENQVAGFTAAHVGRGLSYYVIKAVFDADLFPYGAAELRRCSIEVQGKKVYDMRKDSTYPGGSGSHRSGDPATWEWSTNPALCLLDYLRDFEGIDSQSVPDDELDFESFRVAANVCDEPITNKDATTSPRYTLNGVIDLSRKKSDNIKLMLTAMSGRQMWDGGRLAVFAADYDMPTTTLTDDYILSATYSDMPARDQRTNSVYGTYIDADAGYEPQEYPAQTDVAAQAIEGQIAININLPFCRDHREAQRHAKIALLMARKPALQLTVGAVGLAYGPMSTVYVSSETLGLVSQPFRVVERQINPGNPLVCTLSLVGEDSTLYDWNAATEERDKNSLLPAFSGNPRATVAPSNLAAAQQTVSNNDGSETAGLLISWDTPHPTVVSTLVDFRKTGTTNWVAGGSALRAEESLLLLLPENSTVDIRARHALANGAIGAEAVISATTPDVLGSGTLTWADLTGEGKPQDYADVTLEALAEVGPGWSFGGTDDNFTGTNATIQPQNDGILVTTTAAQGSVTSPDGLGVDGARFTAVLVKIRRVSAAGPSGDFETITLRWKTAGHGLSATYQMQKGRKLPVGRDVVFAFYMGDTSDWTASEIEQVQILLGFQAGDAFEVQEISFIRPGETFDGVESANLVDAEFFTLKSSPDDSDITFDTHVYDDIGVSVGEVLSALVRVKTDGTRKARLTMWFKSDPSTIVKAASSGYLNTGGQWATLKIEGFQVPAGTDRVQITVQTLNGTSGTTETTGLVVNRGGKAVQLGPTRGDVEQGATNTTATSQLSDDANLGGTADWSLITDDGGKPEDGATVGADAGNLRAGVGVNMLKGTRFIDNINMWKLVWTNDPRGIGVFNLTRRASNGGADDWALLDESSLSFNDPDGYQGAVYGADVRYKEKLHVEEGKYYEFFGLVGWHRTYGKLGIAWYDTNNAVIGSAWSSLSDSPATRAGGKYLKGYEKRGIIAQAPVGAVYAEPIVRKYPTDNDGSTNSYVFMVRPYFGEANAGQTEFSNWVPGPDSAESIEGQADVRNDQLTEGHVQGATGWTVTPESGATVGANATNASEDLKNSTITLGTDGYLSYDGGAGAISLGGVNLLGLGFIGDLDADKTTAARVQAVGGLLTPAADYGFQINIRHDGLDTGIHIRCHKYGNTSADGFVDNPLTGDRLTLQYDSANTTVYAPNVGNVSGPYFLMARSDGAGWSISGGPYRYVVPARKTATGGWETWRSNGSTNTWTAETPTNDKFIIGAAQKFGNRHIRSAAALLSLDQTTTPEGILGPGHPTTLPSEITAGVTSIVNDTTGGSVVLSASDAGTTATISVAAFTFYFGDFSVSYNAGSITGRAFGTGYHVYLIDPTYDGGSVSFQYTQNRNALPSGHIYLGYIVTPLDGGTSTGGTQGGAGGLGGAYDPNYNIP